MYIPLNSSNFAVGDEVICLENRFASTFDYSTGFRTYGDETLPYLTLKKKYKVTAIKDSRRKVTIISDDGVERPVPYYRMGVLEVK